MAPTIAELQWQSLTAAANEIKTPNRFLRELLFRDSENLSVEAIEYDILSGDRKAAPFVKKNGKSIMVSGYTETFQAVEAPNIRINRPMEASQAFFKRAAGTSIFPSQQTQQEEIQKRVANDTRRLGEMIDNTIEWMIAQVMRGTLTYQVDEQDAFSITFPKSGSHNITLGTFWDQANSHPIDDFLTAKTLLADDVGLPTTHCIMSDSAAKVFLKHAEVAGLLDNRRITAGNLDITRQFMENGAIPIGTFEGVDCWIYGRKVDITGTPELLIRDKYVEFVSAVPGAENRLYFAAISDWDALESGLLVSERYSKSWTEKDPSVLTQLMQSRPLPVPRRPNSFLSMKVVSG